MKEIHATKNIFKNTHGVHEVINHHNGGFLR